MKILLAKVISGFQTGVDIAGVKAAKAAGLEIGGFIPKGYKTLDGAKPQYRYLYNAVEHSSTSYKERTWDNVASSDATLRIAQDFTSAGERCTLNAIKNYNKPKLDLDIQRDSNCHKFVGYQKLHPDNLVQFVRDWLYVNQIKILNVAGNAESTAPGIENLAYRFLLKLFTSIKKDRNL